MQSARTLGARLRAAALLAALPSGCILAGCGMPAAPQPPSLHLPAPVTDLSALRTGNQVALTWTMPQKDTDKVPLKGPVQVHICRNQPGAQGCAVTATLRLTPASDGAFTDTLPAALTEGSTHLLIYFVELDNHKGRSAGLSNGARIVAGQAPAAVDDLTGEMRRTGVMLRWAPESQETSPAAVRIERKLIAAPTGVKPAAGPLSAHAEPAERTLLVAPAPHLDRALDSSITLGSTYEYRAQRVVHVIVNGQAMELAGALSAPVRIAAVNVFPPAVPSGLAAVATPGAEGAGPAIDLNWRPNIEPDLAGYIVYRHDSSAAASDWQRVSPAQPVAAPGFHDSDVQPGHTYQYAVSAVDQQGHESERSAPAEETVPAP